jgi:hypothetical protein
MRGVATACANLESLDPLSISRPRSLHRCAPRTRARGTLFEHRRLACRVLAFGGLTEHQRRALLCIALGPRGLVARPFAIDAVQHVRLNGFSE